MASSYIPPFNSKNAGQSIRQTFIKADVVPPEKWTMEQPSQNELNQNFIRKAVS